MNVSGLRISVFTENRAGLNSKKFVNKFSDQTIIPLFRINQVRYAFNPK